MDQGAETTAAPGSWAEVLWAFLRLGLTSFGGPVAHIGYFRQALVVKRRWLSEAAFADLVALCQFLPGPASSQVGFAIGLMRAGPLGALAAFIGFTLPSALLMTAFALGAASLGGAVGAGLSHGLKLVAVAVVAQALMGMARSLTPDARRAGIAVLALVVVTLAPPAWAQIEAIAGGVLAGLALCRTTAETRPEVLAPLVPQLAGLAALGLFLALLIGAPLLAQAAGSRPLAEFAAVYRSGALVFGGGHVVLPLLKDAVVSPGFVDPGRFLAGYGAAQAVPGPLFSFGAYLGAIMGGPQHGLAGAALGLAALFLPGMLILLAALPFWGALRRRPAAQAAMVGANAAVVGILAGALYDPVWTSAVLDRGDFAAAAAGFVLLTGFRAPPLVVVVLGAAFGIFRALHHI
ncbi:chromate efflux transporter [Phenylobacterium montanum]|uniref:Chromate efflux transporter n=1 Tax=Phenylobacterium montanum TaxID=2823693 RepID=A0A975IVN2_9CAUL|nr:chromate efflux transporter [Caulobacter sp. S6]QUD88950.1 chromate efflux transporter [Caulobacter sp. S6]